MLGSFLLHSLPPLKFSLSAAQAFSPPQARMSAIAFCFSHSSWIQYACIYVCTYVGLCLCVCCRLTMTQSARLQGQTTDYTNSPSVAVLQKRNLLHVPLHNLIDDLKRALKRSLFYPQALLCNNNNLHGVRKPRLSYCMLKLDWKCRCHTSVSD